MPGGTAPVGTHHQPRLENGRGFGEFADDRGELAVKPVLVLAYQRPELVVHCPGTDWRAGVAAVAHRGSPIRTRTAKPG